jgi:hypothetical protein
MSASSDPTPQAILRSRLASIPNVDRVFVEGPPWRVTLVCRQPNVNAAELELAARSLLGQMGYLATDVQLDVSFLSGSAQTHRVRFIGATLATQSVTRAAATVTLEWNEARIDAVAEGETGPVAALRLCALATLQALEQVVQGALRFHIVGIRVLRVFDSDLVVVLLRTSEPPHRQLIGATLVTGDPHRAAALAVLNATNRILGNFLSSTEEGP